MLKRTPIRRVSVKRAAELDEYRKRRPIFLREHPICEVWLKENGWKWEAPRCYVRNGETMVIFKKAEDLLLNHKAARSDQIHHVNKRRGAMLNDERHWLAVCRKNHERIENDKAWARREGYLLNF